MAQPDWDDLFTAPSAAERPRALLARLVELLTALDPQQLDPDRSSPDTHEGSVLTTLWHRSEDLLEITIDCSADGFASISSPALGAPEEICSSWHPTVDNWHADVLDSVTDALLQRYRLHARRAPLAHPPHLRQP